MSELDQLISYWKDRLKEHPPLTGWDFKEAVKSTVRYLEELRTRKGE